MEETAQIDTGAVGLEAAGVLLIAFGRVIFGIEPTETVEVGAAALAKGAEGKAKGKPVLVGGGEVEPAAFDVLQDAFDGGVCLFF